MKNHLDTTFIRIQNKPKTSSHLGFRRMTDTFLYQQVIGFNCVFCHLPVSSDPIFSGVNNRNHCPYCLTSRHVDLFKAGDRMSACKAPMQAIGLAWKKTRNKYGFKRGELMIVHQCDDCYQISINRIASDDDLDKLNVLFIKTITMDYTMMEEIRRLGIDLLKNKDEREFIESIFGIN
jgi:hypothetical protein